MRELLLSGASSDAALFVLRLVLGGFYVLARFRFFYDPSLRPAWCNHLRHDSLTNKMARCGWRSMTYFWACVVAAVEVAAGLAVIAGFLTMPAAFGLLIVTVIATICTARDKVMEQNPVDALDCVACYFWRVEGLYIAMALALLLTGPGKWSIDYLLFN